MLYFEPNFLDEALVLLDRFGGAARILAGGTRLGFELRGPLADHSVSALINVKRVDELHAISNDGQFLHIGALATAATLATHPEVRAHAPLLAAAASTLGARQLRNVATVGGNVCSGDAISDLTVALLACDARCEIATLHEGPAWIALEQLALKPAPVLSSSELLTAVELPLGSRARYSYQKIMRRRSFELALIAVAASVHFEDDTVSDARIALAGAAATPLLAHHAQRALNGKPLSPDSIVEAARNAALNDAQPADDARASAAYRRHLVRVLTARALNQLQPIADGQP